MSKDMPHPVTRNSPKKDLWEELECARAEIGQQQETLNTWRDKVAKAEADNSILQYQMSVIRAVLAGSVRLS